MANIQFKDIRKSYGDVAVVHGISLDIRDGEFIVIVGPSGCGKSTLLRMVAGLEQITSGELIIGERVVNNLEPKDRDCAMVFQNYALYPHMTVYENMAFSLKLKKVSKDEIDRKVREAAEILDITQYLDRKPKALSGGQRQALTLLMATLVTPKLLLLDEHTAALDPKTAAKVLTLSEKIVEENHLTTLMITHNMKDAIKYGNRLIMMHEGHIIYDVAGEEKQKLHVSDLLAKFQIASNEGDYVILDEPISTEQYAIGFLKGNTELRDAVNAELLKMAEDGTMLEIAQKYVDQGLVLDSLCLIKK